MKHSTSETLDLLLASHRLGADAGASKAAAVAGWGLLGALGLYFAYSSDYSLVLFRRTRPLERSIAHRVLDVLGCLSRVLPDVVREVRTTVQAVEQADRADRADRAPAPEPEPVPEPPAAAAAEAPPPAAPVPNAPAAAGAGGS